MSIDNRQNQQNYKQQNQNQFENPQYSVISFWVFTNYPHTRDFELQFVYQDQTQKMPYQTTKKLKDLKSSVKWCQFDVHVPNNWKEASNDQLRQYFMADCLFISEYSKISTPTNNIFKIENFSITKPAIVFRFIEELYSQNKNDLEILILQVIQNSICNHQQFHLKEFLIQLKAQNVFHSKIKNDKTFTQLMDSMDNTSFDAFLYHFVALEFFDLTEPYFWNSVVCKLDIFKEMFLNVCINFNFLMSFGETQNVQNSIPLITAKLVLSLSSSNSKGLLLRDIVEKYNTLSENDPASKSLMNMRPYIFQELRKPGFSKKKALSFPEIKFLFGSDEDSNEVLVGLTKDFDTLLQLIKFGQKCGLNNKFYCAVGKRLTHFLELDKHNKLSNQQIISLFEIMNDFNENQIELVVKKSFLSYQVSRIIGGTCEKEGLLDQISQYLAKYDKILTNGLMTSVGINIRKESRMAFRKLFQFSFEHPCLRNDLESGLKLIYQKRPLVVFRNFEHIYRICQTDPQRNFMQKLFDLIEMTLYNFKNGGLNEFRRHVSSEDIIRDAIESMIEYQTNFLEAPANSNLITINEIKCVAKKKQNRFFRNDAFINYILTKIQSHLKIENLEVIIKQIFDEQNQKEIEEIICIIEFIKSSNNKSFDEFKSLLIKEFEDLANGEYTLEKFENFYLIYNQSSPLKRLYQKLHPQRKFKIYPWNNYRQANEKLSNVKEVLKNWCKQCSDFQNIESEIDNFREDKKGKSVTQFIKASGDYMKEIDWNQLSILNRDISSLNMFNLKTENEPNMICAEKLDQILQEFRKFKSKVDEIEKSFRSMTLQQVKERLDVQNDNDLDQYIQSFFSSKDSKKNFQLCTEMVKSHSSLMKYLDVFEGIQTQLNLKMKDFEVKRELIQEISKLSPKTSVLGDFETKANLLRNHFDDFKNVKALSEKFAFVIGFKDPLKLLNDKKGQFDRFKELVTDFKDFEITWNNINDLEIMQSFFETLEVESNKQNGGCYDSLGHFDNKFSETAKSGLYNEIEVKIREFSSNYNQYYLFFEQSSGASESLKQWIISLMKESELTIDLSKKQMKIQILIKGEKKSTAKEYSYEELEDKRNIILMKGSSDSNNKTSALGKSLINNNFQTEMGVYSESSQYQTAFIELFRQLEIMNELVENMKNYGYDFRKTLLTCSINESTFEGLVGLVKDLSNNYKSFKEQISEAYQDEFLFTFLHHDMFNQLAYSLKYFPDIIRDAHFLDYLGFTDHNKVRKHFNDTTQEIHPDTICRDMKYLFKHKLNCLSSFYETSDLVPKKPLSPKPFYLVKIPVRNNNKMLYKTILGVSLFANGRLPKFHNILFCSSTIILSKLQAFVNRVYNCPNNQAFMIVLPECLNHENQQEMIRFIREISDKNERKGYLFILYADGQSSLGMHLMEHQKWSDFKLENTVYEDDIDEEVNKMKQDITTVMSKQPMTGKTNRIINECKTKYPNHKIVHLRLTGVIDTDVIFSSLYEAIDRKNIVIHVDIGPIHSKSMHALDQLLFSLVFLNTLEAVNRVIVIPKHTKFYLEFDSSISPKEGKQSIEFVQFQFSKIENLQNGLTELIPISDIPILFYQSYKDKKLNQWYAEYVEELLGITKETPISRMAEINVGLDDTKPKLKAKNALSDDLKNDFFNYLKTQKGDNNSEGMLVHQLIFQRVLHFLAYSYSQCGVLLDLESNQSGASPEIGTLIFDSAKFLSVSSFNSLQLQQAAQTNMFANRSGGLNQMNENVKKSSTDSTVFVTFKDGHPIMVSSKKSLIQMCTQKESKMDGQSVRFHDISDENNQLTIEMDKRETHNYFFAELAHLNPKLITCKLCGKCGLKYNHKDCLECEKEGLSASEYWIENQNSNHVKQISDAIPMVDGRRDAKEAHKIDAFYSFLKEKFGEDVADKMKPTSEKQIVCLDCKQIITDKCKRCSNDLMTAQNYFELNKDNDAFKRINDDNVENKKLRPLDPKNPKTYHIFESDMNGEFVSFISRSLFNHYVLTLDNYSKILQIHVRAKSRLPIVIMGETGCGKTSLIRFLCRFVLDDYFEFFSMHAGICETRVVGKMSEFFDKCDCNPNKDCWMLFDEFNTSDAIGLVKTLMVDRRLGNRTAPVNAIFIATCNPFKVKKAELIKEHLVGLKRNLRETRAEQTSLVYNVHPLPESLFHFTFDFGQLSEEDEKQYAESILHRSLAQISNNNAEKHDGKKEEQANQGLKTGKQNTQMVEQPNPVYVDEDEKEEIQENKVQNNENEQEYPVPEEENQKKQESLNNDEIREESKVISNICIEISKYLKLEFDVSSTSLRDVRRFQIVLSFFKNRYYPAIQKVEESDDTPEKINKKCLVMSVMVCYCLRLSDKKRRTKVMDIVKKYADIDQDQFLSIVKNETDRLLRQFNLDKDVIKNKALSENLLSMFVCLLNKIPLIIIGKPGSSKSLSLEKLFQKLKGQKSSEKFFREFEELVRVSYQGSEYSTSESIEFLFDKAEELLKSNDKTVQGRISVVVFDEIGLAELSKNNPLKVLHSRLEMEDVKVGFLGISNWYLDSSKMNRVLTVSRKDPDEEELKTTAVEMANSLLRVTPQVCRCFESLAVVYCTHKRDIEKRNEQNQGVAGLRDFYHLIKQTAKEYEVHGPRGNNISKQTIQLGIYKAAIYSIRRNFSYKLEYCKEMCDMLAKEMGVQQEANKERESIKTDQLLVGNLTDPKSRSLMVITNQEEVHNRVYRLLGKPSEYEDVPPRAYRVLIGSKFENDLDSEDYCVEVISKVIHYMDQDIILVMHQLEAVYTSLYDLFNQNFKKEGNRNYCRIVQGTISKCLYPVHENFKVTLFLTKEELENADEPLVNRFEKYSLTLKDFMTLRDERKIKKVKQVLGLIFSAKRDEELSTKCKQVFGNFNEMSYFRWADSMQAFKSEESGYNGPDPVLIEIVQIMRGISSLYLARHLFKNEKIKQSDVYLKAFLDFKKRSLVDVIRESTWIEKSTKAIVYTYSSVFEKIGPRLRRHFNEKMSKLESINDSEKRKLLEDFEFVKDFTSPNSEKMNEQVLSSLKSEKAFTETFKKFLEHQKEILMVIKVNGSNELHHMFYLQNAISNMLNDHKHITKHVIICVYYKQSTITNAQSFPTSTEWKDMFIDDVFKGLDDKTRNIMLNPDILSAVTLSRDRLKSEFDGMVDKIVFNRQMKGGDDEYPNRITEYFRDFTRKYGEDFIELLVNKIFKAIEGDGSPDAHETIYELVDRQSDFLNSSESFVQRMESVINRSFESKLKSLIDWLLKGGIPGSMLFAKSINSDSLRRNIREMIDRIITIDHINEPNKFDVPEPQYGLIHPFTHLEYGQIMSIDREQFGDDDNVVNLVFTNYKSLSFFISKKYEIDSFEPTRLAYIVTDLVRLHLTSKNIVCPSTDILLIVFEKLIPTQVLDTFRLFVFDPDLVSNLCLLLTNLVDILSTTNRSTSDNSRGSNMESILNEIDESSQKNETQKIEKEFSDANSMERFRNLINKLITKAFTQSALSSNLSDLKEKYSGLKQSIDNFEERTDLKVSKSESFDLLFMIGDFVDQSFFDNSLIYKLVNSNYDLLNRLDIHNFENTLSELKKILPGCSNEKLIEDRLLTFEVLNYQKHIEGCITQKDGYELKFTFEKVFKLIEESESFALLANSIINSLIKECRFNEAIYSFFEKKETFADNTEANMGKWLEDCLKKYPKRLPYLMISCMTSEIRSFLEKNKDKNIQLSSSFKELLSNLTHYDNKDIEFNKTTLIHLTVIQYLTNDLGDSMVGGEKKDLAVYTILTGFLNDNSRSARSLQLNICKNIKKIYHYNNQQLDNFLKNANEYWARNLHSEIETIRKNSSLTAECYCFNSDDHYPKLIEIFKGIEDSNSDDLNCLLSYLKANDDKNSLLAFYSLVINNYYFKRISSGKAIKRILAGVQKLKQQFSDLLGDIGYALTEQILANFRPNSPLHLPKDSEKSIIQRNSSILFAFASVLCHKNNRSHFNHLMFGCESKSYFKHLKNCYLPGMIVPPNPTVERMMSFLEDLKVNWINPPHYAGHQEKKRIWKCSEKCDFFFIFPDCGQPNKQNQKFNCPLCKKNEIGGTFHKAFEYHKEFSKEDGERQVNSYIENYKKSYSKGYFNTLNSILDIVGEGLNVPPLTTNSLNFLTNSMVLVLNELKIADDSISDLIPGQNPIDVLLDKIAYNFEKCESKFLSAEVSIAMNLLSAKISSELSNQNPIDSVELYYEMEKKIESDVLSVVFSDDQKHYKEYCQNLNKSGSTSIPKDSLIGYIEEENRDNCDRFPLIYHLRLDSPGLHFEKFVDDFTSNPGNKVKSLNTQFVFTRRDDLESLKVVWAYKDFYDDFRQKFNGVLGRAQAETKKIKDWSLKRKNPKLFRKLKVFIELWNKSVGDDKDIQFECQNFRLSKINENGPLTQVLPNRLRGDSGTDILFGISNIIKIQNQMLRLTRSRTQGIPVSHPWDAIKRESIFNFDREEIEDKLNKNCLLTYTDYGRYGAMKMDFDKFEQVLKSEFQKLKVFKDDENLVPQFDYKYESGKLAANLAKLNNSGKQESLAIDLKEKIEENLKKQKSSCQTCPYAQIFTFFQNILLPRATMTLNYDENQPVTEFIQNTVSEGLRKRLKVLGCFESLKMSQLSSFLLLVEILLFKENFRDYSISTTRLTTDEKDKEWQNVPGRESPDNLLKPEYGKSWTLKDNKEAIGTALMRLVLRTSFNNASLDDAVEYYIKDPTLYDLDYDSDKLDEFSIVEDVKLKHCLLLLKSLENSAEDKKPNAEVPKKNPFGTKGRKLN